MEKVVLLNCVNLWYRIKILLIVNIIKNLWTTYKKLKKLEKLKKWMEIKFVFEVSVSEYHYIKFSILYNNLRRDYLDSLKVMSWTWIDINGKLIKKFYNLILIIKIKYFS